LFDKKQQRSKRQTIVTSMIIEQFGKVDVKHCRVSQVKILFASCLRPAICDESLFRPNRCTRQSHPASRTPEQADAHRSDVGTPAPKETGAGQLQPRNQRPDWPKLEAATIRSLTVTGVGEPSGPHDDDQRQPAASRRA
jgi:hypothetical protein